MIRTPSNSGDVRHHMLKLDIRLHQRLLHALDVSRGVIDQPFAMAQNGLST
jgi:hypothetical protein